MEVSRKPGTTGQICTFFQNIMLYVVSEEHLVWGLFITLKFNLINSIILAFNLDISIH